MMVFALSLCKFICDTVLKLLRLFSCLHTVYFEKQSEHELFVITIDLHLRASSVSCLLGKSRGYFGPRLCALLMNGQSNDEEGFEGKEKEQVGRCR